jgi:sugar lactone lactonase YvrE
VAYAAATGTQQWVARAISGGYDSANDLVVSPDGSTVFATGDTDLHYGTVAYRAADGQLIAAGRAGPSFARALAISPDGAALFVTGTAGSGQEDYGTIAYDLAP